MMSSTKLWGSPFICRNAEPQAKWVCASLCYKDMTRQAGTHTATSICMSQIKISWGSVFCQGQCEGEGGRFHSCGEFGEEGEKSAANSCFKELARDRQHLDERGGGGRGRVRRWAEKTRQKRGCFPSAFKCDTELSDSCL